MLQDDILCLIFSHPLIKLFLFDPRAKTIPETLRSSPKGRSIFSVRYRCLCEIIASVSTEGTYGTARTLLLGACDIAFFVCLNTCFDV